MPCRNSGSVESAVAPLLIPVVQMLLLSVDMSSVDYTQVAALVLVLALAPHLGLAQPHLGLALLSAVSRKALAQIVLASAERLQADG